jgi:hypothetical protein
MECSEIERRTIPVEEEEVSVNNDADIHIVI